MPDFLLLFLPDLRNLLFAFDAGLVLFLDEVIARFKELVDLLDLIEFFVGTFYAEIVQLLRKIHGSCVLIHRSGVTGDLPQ